MTLDNVTMDAALKIADAITHNLDDRLNEVLVEYQTLLNIMDGGCPPDILIDLDDALDRIKSVVFRILEYQLLNNKK